MINKIAAIIGTTLTVSFLLGVTFTLNKSNMIGWFDILPVIIIMAAAIFMMMIEVLETFDIHVADALAKKILKKKIVISSNISE
jgi:hypothetical protein